MQANHDRERRGALNFQSNAKLARLANVHLLGWGYGNPEVLSSYKFKTKDDGAPNDLKASCDGYPHQTESQWLCQHRDPAIAGMVDFYNRVPFGTAVNFWQVGEKSQVAWGRGK